MTDVIDGFSRVGPRRMQFAAMYMSDDSNRSFFLDSYTNADQYKKAVDKLNPTFGVDTRLNDAIKVCDSLISSLSEKCFNYSKSSLCRS
jgi:hypothetical protein